MITKPLLSLLLLSISNPLMAVDFIKDIKPILEKNCTSCHGPVKDKGDLRLHTHEALLKGDVITPGKAQDSYLFELISLDHDDEDIMPPKGDPLSKEQIEIVKQWISEGAKWPKGIELSAPPKDDDKAKVAAETPPMIAKNDTFKHLVPIINKYCVDCHGSDKQKGDFRIDNMDQDLVHGIHAQHWYEVLDILNLGEMPPKKKAQPNDEERRMLVETLTRELQKAKEVRKGQISTVMRRLNNEQYNNTLKELLRVDFNFARDLPEDAYSPEGMKNNGETLDVSTLQMEYYMNISRQALSKVITLEKEPEIMNFNIAFGLNKNPQHRESLTMGPGGKLIPTHHYKITETTPNKTFSYNHKKIKTEYIYNEGYKGNSTIKGDVTFKGYHHAIYPEIRDSKDLLIPEGLTLRPRGDLKFGKAGGNGPTNHMKLVLRDFPRSGPIKIRVKASQSPNASFAPYVHQEALSSFDNNNKRFSDQSIVLPGLDCKPSYPPNSNLEKPKFIIVDELKVAKAGLYQLDALLASEVDGPVNILIGKSLLENIKIKKGAQKLLVPIALVKLEANKAVPIHITAKKKAQLINFVLTPIGEFDEKNKQFEKGTRRNKNIAFAIKGQAIAKFTPASGKFAENNTVLTASQARPIKEGEYHLPKALDHTINHGFEIKTSGLYQLDLKLSGENSGNINIHLNHAAIKNLRFRYDSKQSLYSAGLIHLQAGHQHLHVYSRQDIPVTDVTLTPVQDKLRQDAFAEHKSNSYGYLRSFIGNRRDDGQEFRPLPQLLKVDAPLHDPGTYEFTAFIEDYPLPGYNPNNKNYLANLLHIGFWNSPWNAKQDSDIVIHSIEFEGNSYDQWPSKAYKNIFIDSSNKAYQSLYAKEILENFLTRAYRRPLSSDELKRHHGFWSTIHKHTNNFDLSIRDSLAVALSSPQFLYINEPEGTRSKQLTEFELASRLSYFIWNTMPDNSLIEAATKGTLKRDLNKHVRRMIQDPRSFNFSKNFASQWLDVDRLERVIVDKKHSNGYSVDIKNSFKMETYSFFDHVLREDKSFMNLIDSDYALLDWRLANFYKLPAVNNINFQATPVTSENRRGGILTNGGLLTALSTGKHSSPIKRGVWLARKIVDSPPPKPPPNVPELDEEDPEAAKLTIKQQLEKHRHDVACRDCHMKIDPWGLPFEHYDTTGRLKKSSPMISSDTTFPDGTKVDGLKELKNYLLTEKQDLVTRSLAKYLSSYAIGRSLSFADEDEINKIMQEAKANDYKMQSLIESIVNSDLFLKF